MNLSVVTPTFNEAESIGRFVHEVRRNLEGHDYEIIIVDDDSPDRTWKIARDLSAADNRVRVLRREGQRRGLGNSVIDGFRLARGEAIACIDADLQHDPAVIPEMIQALRRGADFVVASRYTANGSTGQWSGFRLLGSKAATWLARTALGVVVHDPMSGYFMLRRKQFESVGDRLNGDGFKILLELLVHVKPDRVVEVPYTFRPRVAGDSKLSRRVALAYLGQVWRLSGTAGRLPHRLVRFLTVGGLGGLLNLGVMAALIHLTSMKDWYASALATSVAILHNYLLNNTWTFRDRMRRGQRLLSGCFSYVLISMFGLAITTASYVGITKAFRAGWVFMPGKLPTTTAVVAQGISILIGSLSNYELNKNVTWKQPQVTQPASKSATSADAADQQQRVA